MDTPCLYLQMNCLSDMEKMLYQIISIPKGIDGCVPGTPSLCYLFDSPSDIGIMLTQQTSIPKGIDDGDPGLTSLCYLLNCLSDMEKTVTQQTSIPKGIDTRDPGSPSLRPRVVGPMPLTLWGWGKVHKTAQTRACARDKGWLIAVFSGAILETVQSLGDTIARKITVQKKQSL